ncbi:MAG: hypothetical protein RQ982_04325 [Gammaproteobacteria bacterium]|nr:hypothetical protein [Gammaproteobacteria bacterium]
MKLKLVVNVVLLCLALQILALKVAFAGKDDASTEVKELSGISIIGNKEAPKSLYIVPWQNSEVGVATSLNSGLLDDSMRAVDKDVFLRELEFYQLSSGKSTQ